MAKVTFELSPAEFLTVFDMDTLNGLSGMPDTQRNDLIEEKKSSLIDKTLFYSSKGNEISRAVLTLDFDSYEWNEFLTSGEYLRLEGVLHRIRSSAKI